MRFFVSLLLLAAPSIVSACEGDCIVGVTNAFVGNYTILIDLVFRSLAQQISNLIPSHPSVDTTMTYLEPIQAAYRTQAYQNMETGIFPSHFHGKCLDGNGQEPAGCPDPDCPVVCGTSGSMVHFYPSLRFIAFKQTYLLLERVSSPGSPSYNRVETLVLQASQSPPPDERRRRRAFSRVFSPDVADAMSGTLDGPGGAGSPRDLRSRSDSGSGLGSRSGPSSGLHTGLGLPGGSPRRFSKRMQDISAGLKSTFQQMHPLLEEECGGNGVEQTNGLPRCSWEVAMKEYILSFS